MRPLPIHPDSDSNPILQWGDPIPLIWQRLRPGSWLAWPVRQFTMKSAGGPIRWALGEDIVGRNFYSPNNPVDLVPPGTESMIGFGHETPAIGWGEHLPSRWGRYEDGRETVQLGTLRVRHGAGEIWFHCSFDGPAFFYAQSAENVRLDASSIGRAEFMGGDRDWGPSVNKWRRRDGADRWSLGTLHVEPDSSEFVDHPTLLPLNLPSEAEIEGWWKSQYMAKEHYSNSIPYLCLMNDMARSPTIMQEIGRDEFSAQMQRFLSDNSLVRISDGASVAYSSDRNLGNILSTLRRYGENYMMYDWNWANADSAIQEQIRQLIEAVGYEVVSTSDG